MESITLPAHPESAFSAPASARKVLGDKRGLSASLPEVLGAVAVSIAILAAAGFGIGAAINFGQDSSAKGVLDSISAAQTLHQSKTGGFGTLAELTTAGTGGTPALTETPDNASIAVSTDKRNFCAVIESGSMAHTKYWVTGKNGKIYEGTAPTAAVAGVTCPA